MRANLLSAKVAEGAKDAKVKQENLFTAENAENAEIAEVGTHARALNTHHFQESPLLFWFNPQRQ